MFRQQQSALKAHGSCGFVTGLTILHSGWNILRWEKTAGDNRDMVLSMPRDALIHDPS